MNAENEILYYFLKDQKQGWQKGDPDPQALLPA